MRHRVTRPAIALAFAFLITSSAPIASAQDAAEAEAPEAEAPGAESASLPSPSPGPGFAEPMAAWIKAWSATPRLVSLQDTGSLEDRIKLLGEKTFSNREWKTYWKQQGTTGTALAAALTAAGAPPSQGEAMNAWVALAANKVTNQDRYFTAIQSERDAVEDRMEAGLDPPPTETAVAATPLDQLNPHQARRQRLEDLEGRIETQRQKRGTAEAELAFVKGQLAGEEILAEALGTDLELARQELAIATGQSRGEAGDDWRAIWNTIATASSAKEASIAAEVDHGQVRLRARQVEIELGRSQLVFRDRRIAEFEAEYEKENSVRSLIQSTQQTLVDFARTRLWRVLLSLLLIGVTVRVTLRLLRRGVQALLGRMDDDPDKSDASDQRRQTLADVFTSVAGLAVYIIAGLIALEELGVNTGPLLGSVAILGLAVSFGSQNLVRDVVNGFFILLENQFAVGDVITISEKTGTVERVTIRSTWIRAYNGDVHVLPNGTIALVSNQTRGWSRVVCNVGVGYGSDLVQVRDVINRVGLEMKDDPEWTDVLDEAPTWVGVTELGDSAVVVRAVAKVVPGGQWGAERELNERLKVAFDAVGVEIPFPQQVVHRPEAARSASEDSLEG